MSPSRLDRINLSTNSRDTVAALIKLLCPHKPYSLSILGSILNAGPRTSTLQDIDSSKVSLWSTIPLHPDATDPPAPFSIVTFSHPSCQFYFFCSGESSTASPTEAEETHVKHVFKHLLDIASKGHPTYNSLLTPLGSWPRHRIDTDPPTIVIWAVHAKWARVLAPMTIFQSPHARYVFPRGAFAQDGMSLAAALSRWSTRPTSNGLELEVSEIRGSDLPFVYGGSTVPRSEAYILSRVPYSVCLRSRGEMEEDGGQPMACALMHPDGSIGALHVDPNHLRQGLGKLVLRALTEKLDFSEGRGDDVSSDSYQDLSGGALGWIWTDADAQNEAGNRFFTSLVDAEHCWTCHWTYMLVNPDHCAGDHL